MPPKDKSPSIKYLGRIYSSKWHFFSMPGYPHTSADGAPEASHALFHHKDGRFSVGFVGQKAWQVYYNPDPELVKSLRLAAWPLMEEGEE